MNTERVRSELGDQAEELERRSTGRIPRVRTERGVLTHLGLQASS